MLFINRLAYCSVQSLLFLIIRLFFFIMTSAPPESQHKQSFSTVTGTWTLPQSLERLTVTSAVCCSLCSTSQPIWYLCCTKICLLLKSNLKNKQRKKKTSQSHNHTVEILPVGCRLLTDTNGTVIYIFAVESFSFQAWNVIVITVVMNSDIFQSSLASGTTNTAFSSHPSGQQVSVPPVSNRLHQYGLNNCNMFRERNSAKTGGGCCWLAHHISKFHMLDLSLCPKLFSIKQSSNSSGKHLQ